MFENSPWEEIKLPKAPLGGFPRQAEGIVYRKREALNLREMGGPVFGGRNSGKEKVLFFPVRMESIVGLDHLRKHM